MREEDLGRSLAPPPSFFELLHEDLSNYHIIVIHEYRAKDDCHTVLLGRNIPGQRERKGGEGRGIRERRKEERRGGGRGGRVDD